MEDLEMGKYPGLSGWLIQSQSILTRGRREGQSERVTVSVEVEGLNQVEMLCSWL